jgi:iron complex transport system permease protein
MQQNHKRQHYSNLILITALFFLALFSIGVSIAVGSVHVGFPLDPIGQKIIFNLRLPRTLCAFMAGGMLALAGALMQSLLRNPLADPYVLGVSGGAAFFSLMAMLVGVIGSSLGIMAFLGSLFSMFLVMVLARTHSGWSSLRLLLTGVVVATGWAALISFVLTISPVSNLRGMLFWLMGDLSYAHFSLWQPLILLAGLVISLVLAKPLNLLVRGDVMAQSLGINTKGLNILLYFVSSLLTAVAVSMAGCIGFVGLIVPHILRLLGNSDHRYILPASVLLGGSLLTLADTLARSIMSPMQIPVGIITAFIGVPAFLLLLHRGYRF